MAPPLVSCSKLFETNLGPGTPEKSTIAKFITKKNKIFMEYAASLIASMLRIQRHPASCCKNISDLSAFSFLVAVAKVREPQQKL